MYTPRQFIVNPLYSLSRFVWNFIVTLVKMYVNVCPVRFPLFIQKGRFIKIIFLVSGCSHICEIKHSSAISYPNEMFN